MPNGFDLFLRARRGVLPEGVHPYMDVRPVRVLVAKPGLKFWTCAFLRAGEALDGFAEVSVQHEHGNPVPRREVVEDVVRRRRHQGSRFLEGSHTASLWPWKMQR